MKNYTYIYWVLCLCFAIVSCELDDPVQGYSFVVSGIYAEPSYNTAQIECTIESKNVTIKHVDVQYSIYSDFSKYTTKRMINISDKKYSIQLKNLESDELYYIRFSATDSYTDVLANKIGSFQTLKIGVPTVSTSSAIGITNTTANVAGKVVQDGGAEVTSRGICYSTIPYPTISDVKVTAGKGTGSFSCTLSQLEGGTVYYARAYAINAKGTSYGNQISFETEAPGPVLLSISSAKDITISSAAVEGTLHDNGGASIIEKGVCYSTSQHPTINNDYVYGGEGMGGYTCILKNLQINTVYYVRAYAKNSKQDIYYSDNEIKFITQNGVIDLGTLSAENVTSNSAVVGGNIYDIGGTPVTGRGICYSTSQYPTIDNDYVYGGEGAGKYQCTLSGLKKGTVYYARAYAINCTGIYYSGNEVVFTTK